MASHGADGHAFVVAGNYNHGNPMRTGSLTDAFGALPPAVLTQCVLTVKQTAKPASQIGIKPASYQASQLAS